MKVVNWNLKENIYIIKELEEKNIAKKIQYLKGNIYITENLKEKDMIITVK